VTRHEREWRPRRGRDEIFRVEQRAIGICGNGCSASGSRRFDGPGDGGTHVESPETEHYGRGESEDAEQQARKKSGEKVGTSAWNRKNGWRA